MQEVMNFKCINCDTEYSINRKQLTCSCTGLLEVIHHWEDFNVNRELKKFENTKSGVWRFKPLIHQIIDGKQIVMRGEGKTGLYKAPKKIISYAEKQQILFKHEGENPTGSFKDRGMTVAISEAKRLNITKVSCASTGNTSASLAAYASFGDLESYVVIPQGKVAIGKLSQTIAYGAQVIEIEGTFDDALKEVKELSRTKGMYLLNSINPWRIEGQKTIILELLEQMNWEIPDWIIVPAGNLGNTAAFGKALREAKELELITDLPGIISVQVEGAKHFVKFWESGKYLPEKEPKTLATAINIGDPVSIKKAINSLTETNGLAISVSDQEILDAKAIIDSSGLGCEPASAATLAGIKNLVDEGKILSTESIVAILTGHVLKDPQIISDYHNGKISGINSTYANRIKNQV
ncbi:MAG: threonine synthase [Candidatus Hodarchaeales archaeon]